MEMPDIVPTFIEADSKTELVKKMIMNNLSQGKFFRYFDIQKDGKKWVAWYYDNIKFNVGGK